MAKPKKETTLEAIKRIAAANADALKRLAGK